MNPAKARLIQRALQRIGVSQTKYIQIDTLDSNLELDYEKAKKMEDTAAEYMREQQARILAEKLELSKYLEIPESAEAILILTHGKNNVVFLRQQTLPEGKEMRRMVYGKEEKSNESGYMTAIDMMGDESATFVCLCEAKKQKVKFALQRGEKYFNDYEKISKDDKLCVLEQTRENKKIIERKEIDCTLTVQRWNMEFDDGEDLRYTCSNTREHVWPYERLGNWADFQTTEITSSTKNQLSPSCSDHI